MTPSARPDPIRPSQAVLAQDPGNRAARRRTSDAMISLQQPSKLLGTPRSVPATKPQDQSLDLLGGLMRAAVRSAAAIAQTCRSFFAVTLQPLVGTLAADVKIRTQLGHRELAGAGQTDESMLLFHGFNLLPGHSPESVTHVPGQSVTYVPGSYLAGSFAGSPKKSSWH
jgi:hypothetical protein